MRGFRDTFVDLLDVAGRAAIEERFNESPGERSEGAAEFANPATVSQPVTPSQFPSGQPNPPQRPSALQNPLLLAVGGVGLLITGLVLARLLR